MQKKDRWRLIFVLVVLAVAAYFVFPLRGRIKLGLDLSGGVNIVLKAVPQPGTELGTDSIDRLLVVLRNRIDQYGVTEPLMQRQGADRVVVELPGVDNPEAALNLIGKTALLEFRQVIDSTRPLPPQAKRENYDSDAEFQEAVARWNAYRDQQEALKASMEAKAKSEGGNSIATDEDGAIYQLGATYLTGKDLKNAGVDYDSLGRPVVSLEFNDKGTDLFDKATADNVGKQIAMVLDGRVISAPRVNERISGGRAQISGRFTPDDARGLAIMLRAGALPVGVEVLENRSVGPSLGSDSIRDGQFAGLVGIAAVFIYMIVFYRVLGVTADISLCTTILLLFAMLIGFKATLTLPGVAGIVLTIGMAVDSNILIFERMKEETALGRSLHAVITAGFSKALSTILDANITTVIAAAVLFHYGSGPLRGFALTLTIGIVASLFSALGVNRVLLQLMVDYTKLPIIGRRKEVNA